MTSVGWRLRGPALEHWPVVPSLGLKAHLIHVTLYGSGHPHFLDEAIKTQRGEVSNWSYSHSSRALIQTPEPVPLAQISHLHLEKAPNNNTTLHLSEYLTGLLKASNKTQHVTALSKMGEMYEC